MTIQSPENLGFGRANNLGAGSAKVDCLLFLNPDTLLIHNAIGELYNYLCKFKRRRSGRKPVR